MTIKQYSTIQRQIGVIEGLLTALDNQKAALGYSVIEGLSATINEIWEEEHGKSGSDV